MADKLTAKQEAFCLEYMKDLNATQAAIRAGYSPTSARQIADANMTKHDIAERIVELKKERSDNTKIDAAYVLRQAVKLHERCMQEVKPIVDRDGEVVKDDDGNKLYKFDANGAKGALELIGKHVDVNAFKERIEHSGSIDTMTDDELNNRLKALVNAD